MAIDFDSLQVPDWDNIIALCKNALARGLVAQEVTIGTRKVVMSSPAEIRRTLNYAQQMKAMETDGTALLNANAEFGQPR